MKLRRLELLTWWKGVWDAPPQRRTKPMQPRRFYYLAVPVFLLELAIALLAAGFFHPW